MRGGGQGSSWVKMRAGDVIIRRESTGGGVAIIAREVCEAEGRVVIVWRPLCRGRRGRNIQRGVAWLCVCLVLRM